MSNFSFLLLAQRKTTIDSELVPEMPFYLEHRHLRGSENRLHAIKPFL